jgi:NAD(P)-dependent dehydrogenase (short-subunit alcohol dehydrogenase family)
LIQPFTEPGTSPTNPSVREPGERAALCLGRGRAAATDKDLLMPNGLKRLEDKVCVITGAASPLAGTVADRLAREGATVIGVDQREHGVGVSSRQADLADEDQVSELFAGIRRDFGRLDVLYNNAGLNDREDHSALDMSISVWERVLAANLTTTFLCGKHAIPHLLANDPPKGSVINTASFLAVMGAASSQMAYSAPRPGCFSCLAISVSSSAGAASA